VQRAGAQYCCAHGPDARKGWPALLRRAQTLSICRRGAAHFFFNECDKFRDLEPSKSAFGPYKKEWDGTRSGVGFPVALFAKPTTINCGTRRASGEFAIFHRIAKRAFKKKSKASLEKNVGLLSIPIKPPYVFNKIFFVPSDCLFWVRKTISKNIPPFYFLILDFSSWHSVVAVVYVHKSRLRDVVLMRSGTYVADGYHSLVDLKICLVFLCEVLYLLFARDRSGNAQENVWKRIYGPRPFSFTDTYNVDVF
jgi:hypothetical protein